MVGRPPVFAARRSAISLASGRNDWIGDCGSTSIVSRTARRRTLDRHVLSCPYEVPQTGTPSRGQDTMFVITCEVRSAPTPTNTGLLDRKTRDAGTLVRGEVGIGAGRPEHRDRVHPRRVARSIP